jgi:hypothetical protein
VLAIVRAGDGEGKTVASRLLKLFRLLHTDEAAIVLIPSAAGRRWSLVLKLTALCNIQSMNSPGLISETMSVS